AQALSVRIHNKVRLSDSKQIVRFFHCGPQKRKSFTPSCKALETNGRNECRSQGNWRQGMLTFGNGDRCGQVPFLPIPFSLLPPCQERPGGSEGLSRANRRRSRNREWAWSRPNRRRSRNVSPRQPGQWRGRQSTNRGRW